MKKNLQEETIKALVEGYKNLKENKSKKLEDKNNKYYYEINFSDGSNKDSGGYSKYFTSDEAVGDDAEFIWNLAVKAGVIEDEEWEDVEYGEQLTKEEYEEYTGKKVESKKVEAVTPDKEYQGIKYFDNKDGWCPVCNAQLHYQPVEYAGDDVVYYGWDCDKCGAKGEAYFKQSFIGHSIYDDNFDLIELPFNETKTESRKLSNEFVEGQTIVIDKYNDKIVQFHYETEDGKDGPFESEIYNKTKFKDDDGEEWDIVKDFGGKLNEGKKTEAKLEDIQMEIYEMIQTARNVDKQDKETNIKETIYAMKLDYPEIDEKELSDYVTKKADEIYAGDYDEKMESKQRDFKAEFLALPEKEQEKYKKCIPPLRRGLSNVEAETIAKERGLDAGILWWVTNIGQLTNFKESKKVEATDRNIDKEKVLNMKYADLPDMCYGLLPSDKSIIIIKKGENGYHKTDFDDIEDTEEFVNRENSKMGVTPEQRMVMELRSMSGNWVLPNEGDKKEEDVNKLNNMYEQGTTELERAFTTEVKYWLQALIDDNPNDEVGVQALNVIDDESKVKEIVDELVNGSDDLWEAIHLKIEQLAGIDYRNSTRGKVESKKIKEDVNEENPLDDIANYIKGIVDYNVSITPTGKGFSSYDVNFLNTDDSIMYSVMVNDDAIKDKVRLLNTLVLELKRLYNGKTFADGIREDLLNELNKIHPVDKKVTEAYNYNWKDDIEEVDNTEANDELAYEFAENLIATDPDYADYDDPWDVLSQIICIWKITKRSRLYDYLLKWYGSEEEMKKHIRSFYETSDAIYFETGIGYSIFSADLLGGTADGMAEKEFDAFISNGGKRVK